MSRTHSVKKVGVGCVELMTKQGSPTNHPLSDFSLHADDFVLQQVDAISDAMVVLARLGDVSTEHSRREYTHKHKRRWSTEGKLFQ